MLKTAAHIRYTFKYYVTINLMVMSLTIDWLYLVFCGCESSSRYFGIMDNVGPNWRIRNIQPRGLMERALIVTVSEVELWRLVFTTWCNNSVMYRIYRNNYGGHMRRQFRRGRW